MGSVPCLLSSKNVVQVSSGRSGIALAMEDAGIGKGDVVLVPAFHCESMVSPVLWCSATPLFYRVNADTSIQLEDLEKKMSAGEQWFFFKD